LTVQERSRTYEEIHGVSDCIDETPTFVEECLLQFDKELSRISEKAAYDIAEQQNKAYVVDGKFRLMFLRATCFHPRKAAIRMVAFFEGKLRLFGRETLTRQLKWSDMEADDRACLKAGHVQVLPSRDQSGRPIYADLEAFHDQSFKTVANRLRASMFTWCMMSEDEETQKRGVVAIAVQMGAVDTSRVDPDMVRELPRLGKLLPLWASACHICTDHPITSILWRAVIMGTSHETWVRHRLHFGTYTEIKYSLLGYGIPVDVFPVSDSGDIKRTNLNRWISKYSSREATLLRTGTFYGIDLPTVKDVLSGTGKPIQQHPGDIQLGILVASYLDEYIAAEPSERKAFVDRVLDMIIASSGRFLCQGDDGWWRETSMANAREKVSTTFCTASWKQRKSPNITAKTKTTKDKDSETLSSISVGMPGMEGDEASLFLPQQKKPRYDSTSACCSCFER